MKEQSTLILYRVDAVLSRSYKPVCAGTVSKAAKIGEEPSRKSLQNLVFLLNNSDRPFTTMYTLTMTDKASKENTVETHKRALKASLQKLRRDGASQYCWVREFQQNGSIHWHIFTDCIVGEPGQVNEELSRRWSLWFASFYQKNKLSPSCFKKMSKGDGKQFLGCVRVEALRTEAAGLYAGKEGAKRFQKKPPSKWRKNGGAWWRASRGVECTPIKTKLVDGKTLSYSTIVVDGNPLDIPHKIQFSRALKERER